MLDLTRVWRSERGGQKRQSDTCAGAEHLPNLSVRDNIRMGLAAHHDDEEEAAIRRVLVEFPLLEPLLDRDGGALSGGEQQLLAIARCLISEPDLILLDEPTEGIQPSIVDRIIELLRDLNHRHGVTVVMVEQNLDFITELSHRVLLLQKGVISGEVKGSDAADPALSEEFTGFGGGAGTARAPLPRAGRRRAPPPRRAGPAPVLNGGSLHDRPETPHASSGRCSRLGPATCPDARTRSFLSDAGTLDAYDVVDALPDYPRRVLYPRTRPAPSPRETR